MDWSKIATFASVLSIPASIALYVGWAAKYGPKLMSRQMLVETVLFLCFLIILAATAVSLFRVVYIKPAVADLSRGVYVGRIAVDSQRLAQDYYLRLTINGFNGTDTTVSVNGLDGFIRYREVVNGQSVDRGALPVPSIDPAGSHNLNTGPWSEFWIVLEQRLPSALAIQMANSLSTKGTVRLDLSSLDIWVTQQGSNSKQRLPIWDGVSCQERDGMVFVDKVLNMAVRFTTGATATTGTEQR